MQRTCIHKCKELAHSRTRRCKTSNGLSRVGTACAGWLYKGKDLRPLAIILLAATEEFSYLWGRNKVQCYSAVKGFCLSVFLRVG